MSHGFTSLRLICIILTPSRTGINSTLSPFSRIDLITAQIFSSIFHLILYDIPVGLRVVCNRRFQKRVCFISSSPMPISICILIHPWSGTPSSTFGINAGAKFLVNHVIQVCSNICRWFGLVHFMRNTVSASSSVNRGKVLCIPFRLHPAALQGPQASRAKRFSHLDGVVYNVNSHFAVIRHGSSPTLPIPDRSFH